MGSTFSADKSSCDTHSRRVSLRPPSDKAVRLKFRDQIELIALKTERDIVSHVQICEQPPAIARPGHGGGQIIFFEKV